MNNTSGIQIETAQPWRRRALFGVPLALGIGIFLAACGGGGSTTEQAAPQIAEGRATALAVPPGWVGRVPPSEVINGITVPPEPSPTLNNTTLIGVDSNSNGVRDDVERLIAKKVVNQDEFTNALIIARSSQSILTTNPLSNPDFTSLHRKVLCAATKTSVALDSVAIQKMVINTSDRIKVYKGKVAAYGAGPFFDPTKDCQ